MVLHKMGHCDFENDNSGLEKRDRFPTISSQYGQTTLQESKMLDIEGGCTVGSALLQRRYTVDAVYESFEPKSGACRRQRGSET